jgi:hypothetical protein
MKNITYHIGTAFYFAWLCISLSALTVFEMILALKREIDSGLESITEDTKDFFIGIVGLSSVLCLLGLLLGGCAGIAAQKGIAQGITGVTEIVATNAIQNKALTVAQLSTLATDLAGFPTTPIPQADTGLVATLKTELLDHRQANLTDAATVDAINNAVQALVATGSPTAGQGVMWSYIQDVSDGLKAAVTEANANPSLVP